MNLIPCKHLSYQRNDVINGTIETAAPYCPHVRYWQKPQDTRAQRQHPTRVQMCNLRGEVAGIFQCYAGTLSCYDPEVLPSSHRRYGPWIAAPLADIRTRKPNTVPRDAAYWLVTKEHEVLFYKDYATPQCSADELAARRLYNKAVQGQLETPPVLGIVYIDVAFIPQSSGMISAHV